jgi:hypothetical protein
MYFDRIYRTFRIKYLSGNALGPVSRPRPWHGQRPARAFLLTEYFIEGNPVHPANPVHPV